jgi:galactokinase/mevalonate kinase-like predicted kinase
MIVRSKAPLRISFGGGGTDVPPYPKERGGITLNTTINKYAYTTLIPLEGKEIRVTSLDYDIVAKYRTDRDLAYDGELDLVKATTAPSTSTCTRTPRQARAWARRRRCASRSSRRSSTSSSSR